eukprot:GABV01010746.1.p2 GENE.GABV01010746.1~~GABV01010746.1.p2  ORF type:complete len:119 (+),score=20.85 GABV01010746.1:19-375(+)
MVMEALGIALACLASVHCLLSGLIFTSIFRAPAFSSLESNIRSIVFAIVPSLFAVIFHTIVANTDSKAFPSPTEAVLKRLPFACVVISVFFWGRYSVPLTGLFLLTPSWKVSIFSIPR